MSIGVTRFPLRLCRSLCSRCGRSQNPLFPPDFPQTNPVFSTPPTPSHHKPYHLPLWPATTSPVVVVSPSTHSMFVALSFASSPPPHTSDCLLVLFASR